MSAVTRVPCTMCCDVRVGGKKMDRAYKTMDSGEIRARVAGQSKTRRWLGTVLGAKRDRGIDQSVRRDRPVSGEG